MRKYTVVLLIFLAACSANVEPEPPLTEPAPVEVTFPAPPISTVVDVPRLDKWALWTNGTQLRGANIYQRRVFPELDGGEFLGSGVLGPPYTQADFDALAASGANYLNISAPGLFRVTPPFTLDEAVQENLDRLLDMAAKADLFVVISARTGPGRSEFSILRDGAGDWFEEKYLIETVWEDEAARAAWAEMWRYTAERYYDNPIIVGYDLMVEPNANHILEIWDVDEFHAEYGGTGYDWNAWFPAIVDAIREVDEDTPILVGGMGYSSLDWLSSTRVIDAERIVYTFHQYEPFLYTHQDEHEILNSYPGVFDANWDEEPDEVDRAWLDEYFSRIDEFKTAKNVQIAVNETGIIYWEPGAAGFMRDQLNLFEQHGINYAVWMWYPDWEPMTAGDRAFNFRLGENHNDHADMPEALFMAYKEFWSKNIIRPSSFEIGRK